MPKTKSASKTMTKTAFVRSQPASLSAKEVVEKAKAAGMTLTDKYIYTIRSSAKAQAGKQSGKKPGRPKGSTNKPVSAKTTARTSSSGVEDLLRAAASEIGLSRAISMLQEQRDRVRKVLGG